MTRLLRRGAILAAMLASLLACATAPPPPLPEPPASVAPEQVAAPEPEQPTQEPSPPAPVIHEATVPIEAPPPADEPAPPVPAPVFDASSVSAEVRTATFTDVRALIEELNGIIQRKEYDRWMLFLTAEYRTMYSDPTVLEKLSESSVLKRLNIKLRSLRDYFLYVVYPSRQNDRVDDIDFIGENIIKAITINNKGERLVLYYLERINGTWKIGIGR